MSSLRLVPAKIKGTALCLEKKWVSSRYDPISQGNRLAEAIALPYLKKGETVRALFLGIFPVYHLIFFLKKHLAAIKAGKIKVLVFWEKELSLNTAKELLEKIAAQQALGELPKLVSLTTFFPLSNFSAVLPKLFDGAAHRRLVTARSPYLTAALEKELLEVLQRFSGVFVKMKTTEEYFEPLWHLNCLVNLKNENWRNKGLVYWAHSLCIKRGETALLAVSGVSLEEQLAPLIKYSKRFPVFTLPAQAALLEHRGVRLTALISCDPGFANSLHFEAVRKDLPLLAPLSIFGGIPRLLERVYFVIDDEEKELLSQNKTAVRLPRHPSVVLFALELLFQLGFKRIAVWGADFYFTPFQLHAGGGSFEKLAFLKHRRFLSYEQQFHTLAGGNSFSALSEAAPPSIKAAGKTFFKNLYFTEPKLLLYKNYYQQLKEKLSAEIFEVRGQENTVLEQASATVVEWRASGSAVPPLLAMKRTEVKKWIKKTEKATISLHKKQLQLRLKKQLQLQTSAE